MSPVRTLSRELLEWHVYEVSTQSVPGALASRCLIYDSDAVVRRCWNYPADWAALSDDALWGVLESQPRPVRRERGSGTSGRESEVDAAMAAPTETVATVRSLTCEAPSACTAKRRLRAQRQELLNSCRVSHTVMMAAVGSYATTLRQSGATPEAAIVLVKDAIRTGLGGEAKCEEPEGATLLGAGVEHAIRAYYAA